MARRRRLPARRTGQTKAPRTGVGVLPFRRGSAGSREWGRVPRLLRPSLRPEIDDKHVPQHRPQRLPERLVIRMHEVLIPVLLRLEPEDEAVRETLVVLLRAHVRAPLVRRDGGDL